MVCKHLLWSEGNHRTTHIASIPAFQHNACVRGGGVQQPGSNSMLQVPPNNTAVGGLSEPCLCQQYSICWEDCEDWYLAAWWPWQPIPKMLLGPNYTGDVCFLPVLFLTSFSERNMLFSETPTVSFLWPTARNSTGLTMHRQTVPSLTPRTQQLCTGSDESWAGPATLILPSFLSYITHVRLHTRLSHSLYCKWQRVGEWSVGEANDHERSLPLCSATHRTGWQLLLPTSGSNYKTITTVQFTSSSTKPGTTAPSQWTPPLCFYCGGPVVFQANQY